MKAPSPFSQKIWDLAAGIPAGEVTTYGSLAKAAGGGPMAARSISSILGKAPKSYKIPWHRIVYSNGKVWSCKEYDKERSRLYKKEGILIDKDGKIKNFEAKLWDI